MVCGITRHVCVDSTDPTSLIAIFLRFESVIFFVTHSQSGVKVFENKNCLGIISVHVCLSVRYRYMEISDISWFTSRCPQELPIETRWNNYGRRDIEATRFLRTWNNFIGPVLLTGKFVTEAWLFASPQSFHQCSRDLRNWSCPHKMVWRPFSSFLWFVIINFPFWPDILFFDEETSSVYWFRWFPFPRIQNPLQDNRNNLTKTLIVFEGIVCKNVQNKTTPSHSRASKNKDQLFASLLEASPWSKGGNKWKKETLVSVK
jgi:hypothetical protein